MGDRKNMGMLMRKRGDPIYISQKEGVDAEAAGK